MARLQRSPGQIERSGWIATLIFVLCSYALRRLLDRDRHELP